MIKNYLKTAWRNLSRDKWYTLLNVFGLTIGISFSLFLIFYILDELSYDRYNVNANRIYRINSYVKEPDKDEMRWPSTQGPLAATLQKDYPEVEQATRFIPSGKTLLKRGDLKLYQEKVFLADSNVFKVFTYPLIEGDPSHALVEPNSIVLTESVARMYFGKNQPVLGQTLQGSDGKSYKITAVAKDVPRNSHFIFNVLISSTTLPKDFAKNWGGFFLFTYVLLKPNTNPAALDKKLLPLYKEFMAPIFAQFKIKIHYGVQAIPTIHLHSDMQNEPEEVGSMSYIYTFSAVALFMLIIACINYMNLMTARSARRAKEIGIRKVSGSSKRQLTTQFLVESLLTAIFALLISMGLVALLLPTFNLVAGKFISYSILFEPRVMLILVAMVLFVGLAGGSYPAFYLSHFNPVHVLKGSLSKGSSNIVLRRVLLLLQFSISMTMLICTLVVYKQLQYLRNKDLGFNKDQVVSISVNTDQDVRGKILTFINDMRKNPSILSVSTASAVPGDGVNFNLFSIETKNGYTQKGVYNYSIDQDYIKTLGMHMKEGRNFSGLTDTLHSIIVNENMVSYYGWDRAVGKRVLFPGDTSGQYLEVIGVVRDFNQRALYNPIDPLILFYRPNNNGIQLKLAGKNIPGSIADMQKTWKGIFPDIPFGYNFLDQQFNSQYVADEKRGKIFTSFSILTILITCLGLLGLIAFTTAQRKKEISIRRVMGAGLKEIVPLITRNFVLLVGLSCLIAFPIAFLFMHGWLGKFSYSIALTIPPFLISALIVLSITLATVGFHTVKAAYADPVSGLRTE